MQDLIPAVQVTINYRSPWQQAMLPPPLQVIDGLEAIKVICYIIAIIPI